MLVLFLRCRVGCGWETTYICVDEFALRKEHNYATSVLNAQNGRILAIEDVLKQMTGKIRAVISDFAPTMVGAIQSVFLAATHMLDHFHLIQFFTTAQQRRRRLKEWFSRYQFHLSSAFSIIAKTVRLWENAMLKTIYSPFSNGIMEGMNNKIKLIKRCGFGYRNEAHLFLRLRLETGHAWMCKTATPAENKHGAIHFRVSRKLVRCLSAKSVCLKHLLFYFSQLRLLVKNHYLSKNVIASIFL